jgi:hypothetical protein
MQNTETLQGKIHKYEYLFKQSEITLKEILQFSNWINLDTQQQHETSIQTDGDLPLLYSEYQMNDDYGQLPNTSDSNIHIH